MFSYLNLKHVYYLSSFDSIPQEKTIQVVLQLSSHFQSIYNTDTLSLTFTIGCAAIFYGSDYSIYCCPIQDLLIIAQDNGYQLVKVPWCSNRLELMFYYKVLRIQGIGFIPINHHYVLQEVSKEQSFGSSFF